MDEDENEMICLAFIHRIVEALDRYFGNVCELDVIFNFERVHVIVDEILMAGQIQESSLKEIQKVCFRFNYVFVRPPGSGPGPPGTISEQEVGKPGTRSLCGRLVQTSDSSKR